MRCHPNELRLLLYAPSNRLLQPVCRHRLHHIHFVASSRNLSIRIGCSPDTSIASAKQFLIPARHNNSHSSAAKNKRRTHKKRKAEFFRYLESFLVSISCAAVRLTELQSLHKLVKTLAVFRQIDAVRKYRLFYSRLFERTASFRGVCLRTAQ